MLKQSKFILIAYAPEVLIQTINMWPNSRCQLRLRQVGIYPTHWNRPWSVNFLFLYFWCVFYSRGRDIQFTWISGWQATKVYCYIGYVADMISSFFSALNQEIFDQSSPVCLIFRGCVIFATANKYVCAYYRSKFIRS